MFKFEFGDSVLIVRKERAIGTKGLILRVLKHRKSASLLDLSNELQLNWGTVREHVWNLYLEKKVDIERVPFKPNVIKLKTAMGVVDG